MKRRTSGIVIYAAVGLILVTLTLAFLLAALGQREDVTANQVYRSEALTAMAEAVVEEVIHAIRQQLNIPGENNKIYYQVREPTIDDITIDREYLKSICPNALRMLKDEFEIEAKDVVVTGKITRIQPFDVKGFTDDAVRDRIEKNATLEIEVGLRWTNMDKIVAVSRPFKVVNTVMPVLAESTLFVNSPQPTNFGQWPSLFGYEVGKFPEPQTSLVLDHGWHKYSKLNKKSDFIRMFETDVLRAATVPPGRVFVQKGVVPLTNGARASGMLQKTFYDHESELLPAQSQIPLKQLKAFLAQRGMTVSPEPTPSPSAAPAIEPPSGAEVAASTRPPTGQDGTSPATGSTPGAGATTSAADAVPDEGELFIRFVGHGQEVTQEEVKLGEKEVDGYGLYFASFVKAWGQLGAQGDPSLSGLDLFGRIVERQAGESFQGEGIFGKIAGLLRRATTAIMSKLFSKYDIRISPTLVYGEVVNTYFPLVDYVTTKWTDRMVNQFTFNPNQTPLPHLTPDYLARLPLAQPIATREQLPPDWPDNLKDRWLKLPEDLRKPQFYKILNQTILQQPGYGLDQQEFAPVLTPGSIFAPAWEPLLSYLVPGTDSPIRQYFNNLGDKSVYFLSNEDDRKYGFSGGAFSKIFTEPLKEFNPFLFYTKATDYISAIYDPRNPKDSVFMRKYYNEKDKVFDLNGVIYITGTEPLVLGRGKYRGKCIIITFGKVIFNGFFIKAEKDDPENLDACSALTLITLGGVVFDTSDRIDAQIYSYIFPPLAAEGKRMNVYGGLGANMLDMSRLPAGGQVVYDWVYHVPPGTDPRKRASYYHVAITDEIAKYGYSIRRDLGIFEEQAP